MVVQVARAMGSKRQPHSSLVLIAVIIPTVSVLMAAHVLEVFVWALAYLIFDAAPAGAGLIYFAFVNYTTLGYGDVLPVERWRLLGPITAMTGMLLFGWSTAVIFEVLRRTLVRIHALKIDHPVPSPRRFPSPWSVEEQEACFVVSDANGQKLAYVYFEEEPGLFSDSNSSDDNARCGLIKSAKVWASRTARNASVALHRAPRSTQTRSIGQ
jgi:hypothetical protein